MSKAWLLLLLPAAACTDDGATTKDAARLVTASGPHVVVAASSETSQPAIGCGGGGDPVLGPSVVFVSDDGGAHFDRIEPTEPALTRIGTKDGVFYGIATEADSFQVMRSADGRTWTQVAAHAGAPHDLSIGDGGFAVAYNAGVLTSNDGTTWTDHGVANGLYAPSVARLDGALIVSTADGPTLQIQRGGVWTTRTVPAMTAVWELVPAANGLLATGMARFDSNPESPAIDTIARIDLASDGQPSYAHGATTHPIVTPAGLLDTSGELAPIDGATVGDLAPFVEPFESAAVDGQRVTLLRDGALATSTDGGHTFGAPIQLPLQ